MASILRHRRDKNFTVLPNEVLRNPLLSFRATGLLAHLMSLPPGAAVDSLALARTKTTRRGEGRDAVRTAFTELVDAGYARRHKEQTAGGQWITVIEVTDDPAALADSPAPENPASADPTSVDPALRDQEPSERTTPPAPRKRGERVEAPGFAAFYARYPRKVGRPAAAKAYGRAMKRVEAGDVDDGLELWLVYWDQRGEPDKIPYPATWLNQDRWDDAPPDLPAAAPSARQANHVGLVMLGCEACDHGFIHIGNDVTPCQVCRGTSGFARGAEEKTG